MKIQKFLKLIQDNLLHTPDINVATVKIFIQYFEQCLSQKEYKRNQTSLNLISEYSLKQISLDALVLKEKLNIKDASKLALASSILKQHNKRLK